MSYKLSRAEQETIIRFSEGEQNASVFTTNTRLKRVLAEYADAFPDICQIVMPETEYGEMRFELIRKYLTIRPKKPISAERREQLRTAALRRR